MILFYVCIKLHGIISEAVKSYYAHLYGFMHSASPLKINTNIYVSPTTACTVSVMIPYPWLPSIKLSFVLCFHLFMNYVC